MSRYGAGLPIVAFVAAAGAFVLALAIGPQVVAAVRGDAQRAEQCEAIAGPDGWKFLDGACYDENPWTGELARVDLP
jgi:hypothetical protein